MAIITFRNVVRQMMVAVDLVGVRLRKKNRLVRRKYGSKVIIYSKISTYSTCLYGLQGPNFCWHMDGNDKLNHYGFSIHGCIDGCVVNLALNHLCYCSQHYNNA